MASWTKWVVLLLAVGSVARAQAPQPSLTPFPLELKRKPSGFSAKDSEDLQREFVRLVRKSGALVPDTASLELAVKELKRQDCEREDECLKQLALQAQTLYGLFVSLDYTLEGAVVAAGRVVRDDGKVASALQTISVPKGSDPFRDVAKVALVRLLDSLGISKLSPVRPVDAAVVVAPPPKDEPIVTPPPAPPPEVTKSGPSGMRIAGYTMLGVGAAAGVAGIVVLATANTQLNKDGVIVPQPGQSADEAVAAYRSAKSQQTTGAIIAGVGGAVAVAGLVMVLLPEKSATPAVSLVPLQGGALVSVGGSF